MRTALKYLERRPIFERTISQINKETEGIELLIYDLITKTREEYTSNLREDITFINNSMKASVLTEAINIYGRLVKDYLLNTNKIDALTIDDVVLAQEASKAKTFELIQELGDSYENEAMVLEAIRKHGHAPAYIFAYGYDADNENHKAHSFAGLWVPNEKYEFSKAIKNDIRLPETKKAIRDSSKEDNAILVSKKGIVEAMLVQLVDVNPERIKDKYANTVYPSNFGLDAGGHSRFHSAIGYSFHVPETTVIALGEAGFLRMFKKGHLVFSSVDHEQKKLEQRWDFISKELDIYK